MGISIEQLFSDPYIINNISDKIWKEWTKAVYRSPYASKYVSEIARSLGLEWPYTRREEKLSDYLSYSFSGIIYFKGLGKKKLRTLILCMATAAIGEDIVDRNKESQEPFSKKDNATRIKPSLKNAHSFNSLLDKTITIR